MNRELASFVRALLGVLLIGVAVAVAIEVTLSGSLGVPDELRPLIPLVAGGCALTGALILRRAYRNATDAGVASLEREVRGRATPAGVGYASVSAPARQVAQVTALTLVGVGLGVGSSLLGFGDLAAAIGMLVGTAAALVVVVSGARWNAEVARAWRRGGPFQGYELLTPRFFQVVSAGFLACGLLVGSQIEAGPVALLSGVAGLLVLALLQ